MRLLWFCFTTLSDWFEKLSPLSEPIRCKTKTTHTSVARVSRAWRGLHVFASSSDWFLVLFSSVVIGYLLVDGFLYIFLACLSDDVKDYWAFDKIFPFPINNLVGHLFLQATTTLSEQSNMSFRRDQPPCFWERPGKTAKPLHCGENKNPVL